MPQIGETELDVRALARALWRRAWLLLLLTVGVAAATYFGLGFVQPIYTADTRILIEARESPLTRPRDDSADPSIDFDESAIQSQVEVLRSREIAESVIDKLRLTERPEFDPARSPSLIQSILVMLGVRENPTESTIRQRVMDSYFERIAVYALQTSRVIGVEFSAPNPALAAEVANAIADAFVELQQNAKRESALAATEWLQQEIERLRGRVAEAEQAVADYRERQGLFSVDRNGAAVGDLSTQQLAELNAELARARAARAEAEARAGLVEKLLQEGSPLDASEEVLNSQLIQRLRERQGALRAQMAELTTTLLPTHPRIRALEGQVANLEEQIRDEARKVLASLQTAARVAAAREESLLKSLNEAKGDVSRSNEGAIELRALEREAAAQRELLESFLSRYREAAARTDANYIPADARIISRAVSPSEPSFPKRTMMAIAAAVATLLIASAILLLFEFTSGRAFRIIGYDLIERDRIPDEPVLTPAETDELYASAPISRTEFDNNDEPKVTRVEVERERIVASVPEPVKSRPEDDAVAEPESPAEIEASVQPERARESAPRRKRATYERETSAEPVAGQGEEHVASDKPPEGAQASGTVGLAEIIAGSSVRVALFAGAEGGEGAGAIAFSTAREVAKQKVRCVLVDVGQEPSEALGNERPGLVDLLSGEASFGEVIQRDDAARVHVIPLGTSEKDTPMQRMQMVVGALTHTYDKVIVVADRIDDWPDEFVKPDLAAIVCGPDTSESLRTEVYDVALARGAHSAIIVRYSDFDLNGEEKSAAA
jgi:exopolysaccharide transport family protein